MARIVWVDSKHRQVPISANFLDTSSKVTLASPYAEKMNEVTPSLEKCAHCGNTLNELEITENEYREEEEMEHARYVIKYQEESFYIVHVFF